MVAFRFFFSWCSAAESNSDLPHHRGPSELDRCRSDHSPEKWAAALVQADVSHNEHEIHRCLHRREANERVDRVHGKNVSRNVAALNELTLPTFTSLKIQSAAPPAVPAFEHTARSGTKHGTCGRPVICALCVGKIGTPVDIGRIARFSRVGGGSSTSAARDGGANEAIVIGSWPEIVPVIRAPGV